MSGFIYMRQNDLEDVSWEGYTEGGAQGHIVSEAMAGVMVEEATIEINRYGDSGEDVVLFT